MRSQVIRGCLVMAVAGLLAFGSSTASSAAAISYTEVVTASGRLGSLNFVSESITIVLTSDTSNVVGSPGSVQTNTGVATVNVPGFGTATFANST
jgi:hypothetical protein